jgi:hypothetical protein
VSIHEICFQAEIKEATVVLIRRLICITQTLEPLPPERYITMRLFYSPDAPKNYQPKFFRNVPKKAEEFVAAEPFVTKVGSVSTPYYTLDPGHLRYNALSELPLIDTD